jgi:hypothetical protein
MRVAHPEGRAGPLRRRLADTNKQACGGLCDGAERHCLRCNSQNQCGQVQFTPPCVPTSNGRWTCQLSSPTNGMPVGMPGCPHSGTKLNHPAFPSGRIRCRPGLSMTSHLMRHTVSRLAV